MGQKTNPNILRLGMKQKEWNSKYNEKNKEESNIYNSNDLQIKSFLNKFLLDNGMLLHNLKISYTDRVIVIFLSFVVTRKIARVAKKENDKINLKIKKRKMTKKSRENIIINLQKIRDEAKRRRNLRTEFVLAEKIKNVIRKNRTNNSKRRNSRNGRKNFYKNRNTKRCNLFFLKNYKKDLVEKNSINKNEMFKKAFVEKLLGGISVFTDKKQDLRVIFKNINSKKFIFLKKQDRMRLRSTFFSLRRFRRRDFFKESIIILSIAVNQDGPAELLANYFANQLGKGRRQTYFIAFFKKILSILLKTKLSKTKGFKIIIKGKFNYRPRSKKRIITIGKCPVQTFKAKITQAEATTYTSTGTFGVKILKYDI